MLDIRLLRENPEAVKTALARKKFTVDVDGVLALDTQRREIIAEAESKRAAQKAANTEMAQLPKGSDEFKAKLAEMKALAGQVKELQTKQDEAEVAFQKAFMELPNVPHESVPDGKGEEDNVTVSTWGDCDGFPHAQPHYDLPWLDRLAGIEDGIKITGSGFLVPRGPLARFARVLIQYCLDSATRAGYVEIHPPLLVNAASATATGQLPDKEGQMYHVTGDDLYMIPTAEVPVTNIYRDTILEEDQLPLYHCAYSQCFRREAGSHGKDVRGMNRLHQFDKVEIVKWVHPDTSFDELESLRADSEQVLQSLELPYRVLSICSGDIGFPHSKQYDLDVWAAGQQRWLEVSSCSNFTDFQARRANIRFREKGGKPQFVHTLNGSALGLARVVVALLENNLRADGKVNIPQALQEYFGGDVLDPEE